MNKKNWAIVIIIFVLIIITLSIILQDSKRIIYNYEEYLKFTDVNETFFGKIDMRPYCQGFQCVALCSQQDYKAICENWCMIDPDLCEQFQQEAMKFDVVLDLTTEN